MTRRLIALCAAVAFAPLMAWADDIGAGEDIVIEEETVAVVVEEKAVSLPPPGWKPAPPQASDADANGEN